MKASATIIGFSLILGIGYGAAADKTLDSSRDHELGMTLDYCNRMIALNPLDTRSYMARGLTRARMHNNQGSINDYEKAVSLLPEDAEIHCDYAMSLSIMGFRETAREELDHAIRLDPSWTAPYYLRAILRAKSGDKSGAIDDFTTGLQMCPTSFGFYERGVAKLELCDKGGAKHDFEEALCFAPNSQRNKLALFAVEYCESRQLARILKL